MTDQKQVTPPDTAKYEDSIGIEPDDIDLLTAFTRRVSGELHKVDSQNVGSNSNIRAHHLDQKKILAGLNKPAKKSEQTQETTVDRKPNPGTQQSAPQPKSKAVEPPRQVPVSTSSPISKDVEKRIARLESATNALRKAKKIKRGIKYTVSSNGFKGEIKDAELLAEFVINEVAKGVKTITIRSINDTKDKE